MLLEKFSQATLEIHKITARLTPTALVCEN